MTRPPLVARVPRVSILVLALGAVVASLAVLQRRAAPPAPDAARTWARPDLARTAEAAALMRHVAVLAADSMEGREVGTAGGARARAYVVRELAAAGLAPVGGAFTRAAGTVDGRSITNVLGVVRGRRHPDRWLVVSAHYDHLGVRDGQVFNGADDDASGVAAVLALAARVARAPLAHSVLFVVFDAEERGSLGAHALVADPPVPLAGIAAALNLDMVGRNPRGELWAAGTRHHPALRAPLEAVAARAPLALRFGHDAPSLAAPGDDWTDASDHVAFHERGIPFVYLGVEDHADYHRPTDDVAGIMPDFLTAATATAADVLATLDRALAPAAAPARAAAPSR